MPLVGKWILLGFAFLGVSANGLCQILSCSSSPQGDIVHWQIIDPVVTIALTNYQEIYFAPGDKVTFQAGGCVQTGGIGKTWKRYVNPSGPESGHLYYGTIQIPGLIDPPARIKDVLNQTLTIPSTSGPVSTLSLGYVDDHYGDNGYWGHDDEQVTNAQALPAATHLSPLTFNMPRCRSLYRLLNNRRLGRLHYPFFLIPRPRPRCLGAFRHVRQSIRYLVGSRSLLRPPKRFMDAQVHTTRWYTARCNLNCTEPRAIERCPDIYRPTRYVSPVSGYELRGRRTKTTAIEAADADDWVSLGPDGRLLQLPLWSGRMNDVAFDPNTPGLMYAASPAGGVFRSDDNGSYWYPMSDRKVVDPFTGSLWKSGLHTSHIVALNNSHLIVATGDTDLRAGGFGYDNPPFYLSVDGGVTWRKTGLPCVNPAELDSPSGTVYQLLVDPETNTLFASVGGSVYRTTAKETAGTR